MAESDRAQRILSPKGTPEANDRGTFPRTAGPRKAERRILLSFLAGILLVVGGCTSATSFSGATAPLPTGQTGSLVALGAAAGNCYVPDGTTACSSSIYQGTTGITALAGVTYGSTNAVFLGDHNGNIYDAAVSSGAPTTITQCVAGTTGPPILSLTVIPGTSSGSGTLFYATSGGVYSLSITSPTTCSSTVSTTNGAASSFLAYSVPSSQIVGMTTTGSYFTCTTSSCTSPTALPNLKGTTVTAIAADPTAPVVYVAATTNGSYAIDIFSVSGSTLSSIGNYTGGELSAPSAIAVIHGTNPAQNYCTSGGCNFLYIANAGDDAITQYVLTYSGPSTAPTGVSLNQFNAAYMGCDLFHPSSLAAITDPATGTPAVFMGEDGTSLGPCMGVPSGTFGNNVTAYTARNE